MEELLTFFLMFQIYVCVYIYLHITESSWNMQIFIPVTVLMFSLPIASIIWKTCGGGTWDELQACILAH